MLSNLIDFKDDLEIVGRGNFEDEGIGIFDDFGIGVLIGVFTGEASSSNVSRFKLDLGTLCFFNKSTK